MSRSSPVLIPHEIGENGAVDCECKSVSLERKGEAK
uniref:Vesicle-associated membrane protein n=1 Tax=Rhizophora mucronata TaxID=61149 RepID=A0A2P2Q817_RHIMU